MKYIQIFLTQHKVFKLKVEFMYKWFKDILNVEVYVICKLFKINNSKINLIFVHKIEANINRTSRQRLENFFLKQSFK